MEERRQRMAEEGNDGRSWNKVGVVGTGVHRKLTPGATDQLVVPSTFPFPLN